MFLPTIPYLRCNEALYSSHSTEYARVSTRTARRLWLRPTPHNSGLDLRVPPVGAKHRLSEYPQIEHPHQQPEHTNIELKINWCITCRAMNP